MPVVVGLTGGIGSGKSSVAARWARLGAFVIDADFEARAVLDRGTLGLWLVRRRFGRSVLLPDGSLDRARLAQIVFSDARARAALNARTHPLIIARMLLKAAWALLVRLRGVIVLDTPLLFETRSLLPFCGATVVVYCSEEQQVARATARGGIGEESVRGRVRAQMSLETKRGLADVVIDNSGGEERLDRIAEEALEKVRPRATVHAVFCGAVVSVWLVAGHRLWQVVTQATSLK